MRDIYEIYIYTRMFEKTVTSESNWMVTKQKDITLFQGRQDCLRDHRTRAMLDQTLPVVLNIATTEHGIRVGQVRRSGDNPPALKTRAGSLAEANHQRTCGGMKFTSKDVCQKATKALHIQKITHHTS